MLRRLSIFPIMLALMMMLTASVLPHHHHETMICIAHDQMHDHDNDCEDCEDCHCVAHESFLISDFSDCTEDISTPVLELVISCCNFIKGESATSSSIAYHHSDSGPGRLRHSAGLAYLWTRN